MRQYLTVGQPVADLLGEGVLDSVLEGCQHLLLQLGPLLLIVHYYYPHDTAVMRQ